MQNSQIADVFDKIADLLEIKGENKFRIRSYRNAARSIRNHPQSVSQMVKSNENLTKLPYIGKSTAEKIKEIVESGTCSTLEELKGEIPEELAELLLVPGLGPRKAMELYRELGIRNLEDLKSATESGLIRNLPGMGLKTEQKILEGFKTLESISGRMLYKEACDHVKSIGEHLEDIPWIKRWEVAGSFRRAKETVGDLDILLEASDREKAGEKILEYDLIDTVIGRGSERISVRLEKGIQVDFRFFNPESFGSALQYFTGSKAHGIAVRKIAQQKGWKLNEYGLFEEEKQLAGKDEKGIYEHLGMEWIPPELREDTGEIEAALNRRLPKLVELGDIKGDLHCHSTHTDGANTIEELVEAAKRMGYEYLAITDHSKAVTVAGGLDEEEIKQEQNHIQELNQAMGDFRLLCGVEVDITKDSKLDLDEELLSTLDWVVASVHYNRNMSIKEMTERILSAVKSGVIHCIGHPFGRIIGKREPLDFDFEKVLEACLENGVCLEVNAQPDRLDLPDIFARRAIEAGVSLAIATDAHRISDLDFMDIGVKVARRGWAERKNIINTLTLEELEKKLKIA
ncbi:MAG: DNA polymerase/3'-5' exonuclease PolX [Actinomycetota bacterium]|nr:DNA polymerase/3'-5' exonuclease PolX [Actinomycetota bacterium]